MTFVHDKNYTLTLHFFQVLCPHIQLGIFFNLTHLLNRSYNERILRIHTFQPENEHHGVVRPLNVFLTIRKRLIFCQRLITEFDTVYKKYHLVRILGIRNQLS